MWTSPLVRAVQTAELVAAGLASKIAVEVMPALAPDGDFHQLVAALKALAADANVLLVGHEPGLSGIGAMLVGEADFAALGKAEAARIHEGALRWRCAWNSEAPTR
jgi:phosphohistidine phosphatase